MSSVLACINERFIRFLKKYKRLMTREYARGGEGSNKKKDILHAEFGDLGIVRLLLA